jgi:predicted DCC family thiol-disulfide oxidoreductase YuxK
MIESVNPQNKPVIIYDGICYLCQSSINFIIAHDSEQQFMFTPLQSDFAQSLMAKYGLTHLVQDTFILIKDEQYYTQSDAALEVSKSFKDWAKVLRGFQYLPKAFRDKCYQLIAGNRYKMFGKAEQCLMPSKELSARFIL